MATFPIYIETSLKLLSTYFTKIFHTISMEDYINKFTGFIQEIDLHRSKDIAKMSIAQVNLTFI